MGDAGIQRDPRGRAGSGRQIETIGQARKKNTMLKWFIRLIGGIRQDRSRRAYLEQQRQSAEFLRDLVGVARKTGRHLYVTVEVGRVRQGFVLHPGGEEAEWLYNFAAGSALKAGAEAEKEAVEDGENEIGGWERWGGGGL